MVHGFGGFLPPFHRPGRHPGITLRRDLDLVAYLDHLGYDEVWVGEHHSGGWATISSPELLLAAAAERTRRIKLGTGVVSLPYHHPLMVADRIAQLHYQTGGRLLFGVGAGVLPSDGHMIGLDQADRPRRTAEALDAIRHLLGSDEPLTVTTDWFRLRDATLQLRPRSLDDLPMALASSGSERGMRLAGRYGLSPLTFATAAPGGAPLSALWAVAEEEAAAHGRRLDRADWRIAISAHVAETRRQAYAEAREGVLRWQYGYFRDTLGAPVRLPEGREVETLVERGTIIVGSVEDAVEAVQRLDAGTGGFGTLLLTAQEWAPWEQSRQSYELFADAVAPHFTGVADAPAASQRWVAGRARADRPGVTPADPESKTLAVRGGNR